MKIICRKFQNNHAKRGLLAHPRRTATVCSVIAAVLMLCASAGHSAAFSQSDKGSAAFSQGGSLSPAADVAQTSTDSAAADVVLTVDDDLSDVFLDTEEIDSGVSASYNGKLDIPAHVRLDKIDFGTDFVPPLDAARVTSLFDYRVNPVTGRYVFHTGMDLGAPQGADIHAMKAGRVVRATYDSGYGNFVVIEHADGVRTLYAHCSKLLVEAGDSVKKGQVIARVGSTGNSTGPHLHIEFRKNNQRYDPEWVIGGIYN